MYLMSLRRLLFYKALILLSFEGLVAWCIWDKVFKKGPPEICGRQPLKNLNCYGLPQQTVSLQILQILLDPFLNTLLHLESSSCQSK